MKEVWVCKWKVGKGNKRLEKFNDYNAAYSFIRKLIAENVDISKLTKELKDFGNFQFTNAIAEFITKYVSDPDFPRRKNDLPSDDPETYDDYDIFPEDDFYTDDDETFISIDTGAICCEYNGYSFSSDFVIDKPIIKDDSLDKFEILRATYDNDNNLFRENPKERSNGFLIELDLICEEVCKETWGTSAHPIMVLQVLQTAESPMMIGEIVQNIKEKYHTSIERKAVGRHIDLLKRLEYNIQHCKDGYFIIK